MTRILAGLAATVLLLAAAQLQAAPPPPEEVLKDRVMGNPDAPIEIIEYASLTCPHCRDFNVETLPELKKNYIDTGKAKLIYRDFPIDQLSVVAALMARCAPEDRYYQFIDVLFENQDKWKYDPDPVEALMRIGKLGGLSEADFKACTSNDTLINGIIQSRQNAGKQYDVNSTPSFVINGKKRIVGAQPYEVFDETLKKLEK